MAIVCSQKVEVQALLKHIDRQRKYVDEGLTFRGGFLDQVLRIAIVEAGFEFASHRRATQIVIDEHNPKWVFSTGFSTVVADNIQTGDVCLANRIVDTHGNDVVVSLPVEGGKRVHCGVHLTTDKPVFSANSVPKVDDIQPDIADCVSLAVAQVCGQVKDEKPVAQFLSIRSALNTADPQITPNVLKLAFEAPAQPTGKPVKQWLSKLKPDPIRKEAMSQLEAAAINGNRYLLQMVRKLGEDLTSGRW